MHGSFKEEPDPSRYEERNGKVWGEAGMGCFYKRHGLHLSVERKGSPKAECKYGHGTRG